MSVAHELALQLRKESGVVISDPTLTIPVAAADLAKTPAKKCDSDLKVYVYEFPAELDFNQYATQVSQDVCV